MTLAVILLVFLALLFDFVNGFHDAANAIATVVSTRVLSPTKAVIWAAVFNFVAFLFFKTAVATTIGNGLIDTSVVDATLIFAALSGAIIWNLITWYFGLPASSSHALVGGLLGAAIIKAGFGCIITSGLLKVVASIVLSPLLGLVLGYGIFKLVERMVAGRSPYGVDRWFRKLQLVSSALYAIGHGGNDAQKTMGIIAVLLFSTGYLGDTFYVPLWVVASCYLAMSLGTLMGGWRIVKTMGSKLTALKPIGGFCAENAGALTLFLATALGIPVSTTHTITGAIVGVGAARSSRAVKWAQANRIVWAWIVTIPVAAATSSATFLIATWAHLH